MTKTEQAKIILEALREYFQIGYDGYEEEFYLKGIVNGLKEIEKINEGQESADF